MVKVLCFDSAMLGSKEGFPTLHTATLSSWKALTYGEGSLGESVWSVLLLRRAPQIGTCGQPWILMPGLRGARTRWRSA